LQTAGMVGLANHTVLLGKRRAELPIDDSAAPIRNEQGGIQGVVLVFRDVTERRRLENELHRQAEEFVAADHRKNEFLAMVAHELRNPLAPIQNATQILKHFGSAEPQILEATAVIDRQSQYARRLVDDLMDISRISRGKVSISKQPLDLREVIGRAVEMSRSLIDARQHNLMVDVPTEAIRLEADSARLTQVVVNLLTNAAKYTDPGGRIWLTLEQNEGQAVLRVRDNGIGISQEMLPRVFDLFSQAQRASGRAQGGLGIGLSLVRRLVEMHGGTVQVFSQGPGQGSELVVRLPVIDGTHEPPPASIDRERSEQSSRAPFPRRVLVVDDNRDAAESLALLLRVWGHDVQTAYDGLAALQVASAFQPEIVLLDLCLPKLNGYEIAASLRQQPGLEKTRLIALSALAEDDDHSHLNEGQFDLRLVKPVEPRTLENVLSFGDTLTTVVGGTADAGRNGE